MATCNLDLSGSPVRLFDNDEGSTNRRKLDAANVAKDINEFLDENQPKETKRCTEKTERLFNEVMMAYHEQAGSHFTELKDIKLEDLPSEVARFFMVVRKKNGSCYNGSSLQTYYQSLARFLASEKFHSPLDIKEDLRFKKVREVLKLKCTESAQDGERPGKNASRAVSSLDVKLAYDKQTLGRSNPRALVTTVHQICMTGFGCRANKETYEIKNEDIIHGPLHKTGFPEYLELSERITKTRRGGSNDVRDISGRVYLDEENEDVCNVRTILMYQDKKTSKQIHPSYPFFLTVKQSAEKEPEKERFWYTDGRMGINMISGLFKKAFEKAGADVANVSGTSCRKSMMQAGAEALVPGEFMSKMLGQKNINSKLEYLRNGESTHKAASLVINRKITGKAGGSSFGNVLKDVTNTVEGGEDETKKSISTSRYNQGSCYPNVSFQAPPQLWYGQPWYGQPWYGQPWYGQPQPTPMPSQPTFYPYYPYVAPFHGYYPSQQVWPQNYYGQYHSQQAWQQDYSASTSNEGGGNGSTSNEGSGNGS